MDNHGYFKTYPDIKYYWWVLAILTLLIQIDLIYKIGWPLFEKRFVVGNSWVEEEKKTKMWKKFYCEGAKAENAMFVFIFTCQMTKS